MNREAPTPTLEQTAASLIDQAKKIKKQGLQQEIPVYTKLYENANGLAARFRTPGASDNSELGNIVDKSLGVNPEKDEVCFTSGSNQAGIPHYTQWISPSLKEDGLFVIIETASVGMRIISTRASIAVSQTNLTEFPNWSRFFYEIHQAST